MDRGSETPPAPHTALQPPTYTSTQQIGRLSPTTHTQEEQLTSTAKLSLSSWPQNSPRRLSGWSLSEALISAHLSGGPLSTLECLFRQSWEFRLCLETLNPGFLPGAPALLPLLSG